MGIRVGILTGGGDCPGLNAVIRAVVRGSVQRGSEVVGVREGWRGLVEGRFTAALKGDKIVDVPLAEAVAQLKTVPQEWYEVARAFFG